MNIFVQGYAKKHIAIGLATAILVLVVVAGIVIRRSRPGGSENLSEVTPNPADGASKLATNADLMADTVPSKEGDDCFQQISNGQDDNRSTGKQDPDRPKGAPKDDTERLAAPKGWYRAWLSFRPFSASQTEQVMTSQDAAKLSE